MTGQKPKIAVVGCGGTLSTVTSDCLDTIEYLERGRKLEAAEILETVPELAAFAQCIPISFRTVSSSAIGPTDWLELASLLDRLARPEGDFDGFVIIHGTGTLEEAAYFQNLVLDTDKPVVFVGAQRPLTALGSDAAVNLLAAVRTAACQQARGRGVLVVLNDEIHAAREVTKTSTYRLQAFRTPDFGLLGQVDGDQVCFYRSAERLHTRRSMFAGKGLSRLPRVDIAYSYAGSDSVAIDAYMNAGAKGIVSAGFAPGLPSPAERSALTRAIASGVIVVQSSRAGSGRVAQRAYLRENGFVAADNLTPQKARILVALALTETQDAQAIQEIFDTH